jgi:hypothetical protein
MGKYGEMVGVMGLPQGLGQARQRNSQKWLDSVLEEAGEADSLLAG